MRAVLVAEQLDLDVAWALHELLDEHAIIAERGQPLALARCRTSSRTSVLGEGEAHALAAAAPADAFIITG